MPSVRFAYSAESSDRPVSNDDSSYVVMDNEEKLPEAVERRTVGPRRSMPLKDLDDYDDRSPAANIREISKLVRRAISRDLENWNALERYLDRASGEGQQPIPPHPRPEVRSRESRKNEDDSYPPQVNQLNFDSSKQPSLEVLRQLEARVAKLRPAYSERVRSDASGSATSVGADASIDVTADSSLPMEDIFQPRPQIIKYTFLRKATTRLDEPNKHAIDNTTPRNYGDNLIREEIANDDRDGRLAKGNVKVTSIQVSELPRHKTRHHHGELPKRDYTAHRHRSAVAQPIVQ